MSREIRPSGLTVGKLLQRSVLLWVGIIFLIVGTVPTVIGIQTAGTELVYRIKGLVAEATVLEQSIRRAKRGENSHTRYLISYRFLSEQGREIESAREVSVEAWEGLEAGRKLRVTYFSNAPESNRIEGENEWVEALILIGFGGIFTLIGGGLALTDLRSILRVIRVSRDGLFTQGTVIRAELTRTRINRVPQWCVYYRYRDNRSREYEGASHLLSPEEGRLWKEGDTGTVRFDEQRPSISVWIGQP